MQKNNKYEIKKLEWDTDFFGVNSAKVILNNDINKKDIDEIIKYLKDNNYVFITIQNRNNNDNNNYILKDLNNIFIADVNIQFTKKIDVNIKNDVDNKISIQNNVPYIEDIEKIASTSFIYSRFTNDKNLRNGDKVYCKWVSNSFQNQDKYFALYKENNNITGFLLFSLENESLVIELIAVDSKLKHKGIGKKLINSIEVFSKNNNIKNINVGTQVNNINAQNFYINCGFKHKENHSIYHLWLKNGERWFLINNDGRIYNIWKNV